MEGSRLSREFQKTLEHSHMTENKCMHSVSCHIVELGRTYKPRLALRGHHFPTLSSNSDTM